MKHGIPVNENTMREILEMCEFLGIDFSDYFGEYRPGEKAGMFEANY